MHTSPRFLIPHVCHVFEYATTDKSAEYYADVYGLIEVSRNEDLRARLVAIHHFEYDFVSRSARCNKLQGRGYRRDPIELMSEVSVVLQEYGVNVSSKECSCLRH